MKKQTAFWLLLVASVFAALLVGFFLGRNLFPSDVQLSKLPQATYGEDTTTATTDATELSPTAPPKVNINTATADQLQTLPGIGPKLAEQIITYRDINGPFSSLLDLTNVKGFGLERITQILDYATVGG